MSSPSSFTLYFALMNKDRILYEDEHLLVVDKLANELTVKAGGEGKLPLFDFLRKDYPGLRVLHRLDYGTSGCLAFARMAEAAEAVRLSKFKGWHKTYRCIAAGHFTDRMGSIRTPLPAREHDVKVEAVTNFRVAETFRDGSFVEASIETGRKHQIRQHLASIGHPLLLDPLYGDKKADRLFAKKFGYRRFFLHASSLTFPHPITGKIVRAEARLPSAFQQALDRMRGA